MSKHTNSTNEHPNTGDRYTHDKWPPGTPDAVVGSVVDGYVKWAERGGSETPGIAVRFLNESYGWRKK